MSASAESADKQDKGLSRQSVQAMLAASSQSFQKYKIKVC